MQRNEIDTWDYQLVYTILKNQGLVINPVCNMSSNIGFGVESTHTNDENSIYNNQDRYEMLSIKHPKKVKLNHKLISRINKTFSLGFFDKLLFNLKRVVAKIFNLFTFNKIIARFIKRYENYLINTIRYIDTFDAERKRYKFYKKHLKYLGKNVLFDTGVFIYGMQYVSIDANTQIDKNCIIIGSPSNLELSHRAVKVKENDSELIENGEVYIGKHCHISQNTMIYGYGGVHIGNNCVMSAGSKIYSLTSMPTNPYNEAEIISIVPYDGISPTLMGKVVLEDNVWLGLDAVVSPGITIGKNSFARSNSFVLKSFGENSYIAGDPAVYIKPRFKNQ
jgi:acetyltransferase-like isoleucine patch superfamily enzyme